MRIARSIAAALVPWLVTVIIGGLFWLIFAFIAEGMDLRSRYEIFWLEQLRGYSFWIFAFIWFIISTALAAWASEYDRNAGDLPHGGIIAWLMAGMVIISFTMMFRGIWDIDKDEARFYDQDTVFVVKDLDQIPESLQWLLSKGSDPVPGEVPAVAPRHGMDTQVIEGSLSELGWLERGASAQSARAFMAENSGGRAGTEVLYNTLAYVYAPPQAIEGEADDVSRTTGTWTMIRDGGGINKPLESIVYWDGVSDRAEECRFDGDYQIDRALKGSRSNNIRNEILQGDRRHLKYNLDDAYGYCDGDRPVVVIPMRRLVNSGYQVLDEFAGVLLVTGSPNGEPNFELRTDVAPGEIPGPVYPISLAEKQRELHTWLAGRENRSRNDFGFETAAVGTQGGNASEFNLFSLEDGRAYWVTPLTLRGTASQIIVAYAVVPSDAAQVGELNELRIYVVDDQDPDAVVINQFERAVTDLVERQRPGFIPAGGIVQEFIPGENGQWSAFGVREGLPIFRLRVNPRTGAGEIIELAFSDAPDSFGGETTDEPTVSVNPDSDLSQLSEDELEQLIADAINELQTRD